MLKLGHIIGNRRCSARRNDTKRQIPQHKQKKNIHGHRDTSPMVTRQKLTGQKLAEQKLTRFFRRPGQ